MAILYEGTSVEYAWLSIYSQSYGDKQGGIILERMNVIWTIYICSTDKRIWVAYGHVL